MSNQTKVLLLLQFSSILMLTVNLNFRLNSGWFLIQSLGILLCLWGVMTLRIGNFNIQPEVKSGAEFIKKGPYRISRNPIYTGLIIFFGASVLSHPDIFNLFNFVILSIALIVKIKLEEKFLEERFGKAYTEYKKKTFALIPLLW